MFNDFKDGVTGSGIPCCVLRDSPTLMTISKTEPQWLRSARAAWPKNSAPQGLDSTWSPYWIKRFLTYLEHRNDGEGGDDRVKRWLGDLVKGVMLDED